jgi:hypothetical protein
MTSRVDVILLVVGTLHMTSRFSLLAPYPTERLDVILHQYKLFGLIDAEQEDTTTYRNVGFSQSTRRHISEGLVRKVRLCDNLKCHTYCETVLFVLFS